MQLDQLVLFLFFTIDYIPVRKNRRLLFKVANPPALILFQVAIQCLETVFKISPEDTHLAVSQPLTEMFTNSVCKVCWHFFFFSIVFVANMIQFYLGLFFFFLVF